MFRQTLLGRPPLRDRLEALAQVGLVAELFEPRQLGQALQPEHALEQRRRPLPNSAAHRHVLPPGFGDEAALGQSGHGRVRRDPADPRDVRSRARAEIRHDRQRLERGLRERALHRPLDEPRTRLRGLARGAKRVPARDALEDDPAPPLAVALAHQTERRLHALRVVVGRGRQLGGRQRRRRDHEQRLERPRELVERVRRDQAERAVQSSLPSSARATRIGANGAACDRAISPERRSSSNARNATACSTRDIPATSPSKSKRLRRRSTARNRSRNCDTGGNRSSMCASDSAGGSAASARSASASSEASCGASRRSGRGASGAGPRRKKRSPCVSSRSASSSAARFARRYSASRRASSSAASSGSSSASSAASSGKSARALSSSSAATSTRNSPEASRSTGSRRSQNAMTISATSSSASASSSRRTRVRSRSNGPSKASRSSSSSPAITRGKLLPVADVDRA